MTTSEGDMQTEKQLVVFDLAEEAYGVNIGAVREIIRMQNITSVPRTSSFVEGVINLRGKVIPVVDIRKKFDLPIAEENEENRIVVVDIGGQDIGVIVDAVTEVLRIAADSVEAPSSFIKTADSDCIMGIAKIDDRLITLLDLERVLSDEERIELKESSMEVH